MGRFGSGFTVYVWRFGERIGNLERFVCIDRGGDEEWIGRDGMGWEGKKA